MHDFTLLVMNDKDCNENDQASAFMPSLVEKLDEGVGVAVEDVRVLAEEQRAAEADAVAEEEPVEVERLVAGDSCIKRIRLKLRCATFFLLERIVSKGLNDMILVVEDTIYLKILDDRC